MKVVGMIPWEKVLTDPLGIVGYVLFLIFSLCAQVERKDERRWVPRVAIGFAAIALVAGLFLAYFRIAKSVSTSNTGDTATQQQQTGNVAQTATGIGAMNIQGTQGNVTVEQYLGSVKPSGKQSEKQPAKNASESRPWVSVEQLASTSPLTFDLVRGGSATVHFLLHNSGGAPATNVDIRGRLFPKSFVNFPSAVIKGAESTFCDRFRTQQDEAIKFSLYQNQTVERSLNVNLPQSSIEEAIKNPGPSPFPGMQMAGQINVSMVLCIDYQSPSDPVHHQSQYALQFVIPGDRAVDNTFSQIYAQFEPRGSYSNAVVIGMGQNID
jgi:hypothetical protein